MQTIKIVRGPYAQRGHGIGNIFRSLAKVFIPVARTVFRASKPLVKKAAKVAGREALQVGMDTLGSVAEGEDVSSAIKKNVKAGSKRVMGKAKDSLEKTVSAAIKGRGKKRRAQSTPRTKKTKKARTIFD